MNYNQGIIFKTSSGQPYVYVTSSNQILTLDAYWYQKTVRNENDSYLVFDQLQESGIDTKSIPDRIDWPVSWNEYLKIIRNAIPMLVLEITQECTLRCDYCIYSGNYRGRRIHSNKHMDWRTVKAALDFYAFHCSDLDKVSISFYGGEALMRFSLIKRSVDYIHSVFAGKEVILNISSNGTTLSGTVVEWLQQNADVGVTVTVNGYAHDAHRKFPSGEGSLRKIQENLLRIKHDYPEVWDRIDFIANGANYKELLEIRNYYAEYIEKPPALTTGIIEEDANDLINEMITAKEEKTVFNQIEHLLYDEQDEYILSNYKIELTDIASRLIGSRASVCFETASCMPLSEKIFVSATGELGICESVHTDNRLGNIFEGINIEWAKVLYDEALSIFNTYCRTCWCQRLCPMCYTGMRISDNGEIKIAEGYCERMQDNIRENLIIYCEMTERSSGAPDCLK